MRSWHPGGIPDDSHLASRNIGSARARNLAGFLGAAIVNILIVLALVSYYMQTILHREFVIFGFVGIGLGAAYAFYTYRIERLNERMKFLEELAEKNRRLQEASRQLAITRERNRMGRELHDSISQGLHGLVFTIHSLRNNLQEPPQDVLNTLNHMEATS